MQSWTSSGSFVDRNSNACTPLVRMQQEQVSNINSSETLPSQHNPPPQPPAPPLLSTFPTPPRCLWLVSTPSVKWGVFWVHPDGVRSLSVGPSHLARRASRPELGPSEGCVFSSGELLNPFNTRAVEKGVRPFFVNVRSATPNINSIYCCLHLLSVNTQYIIWTFSTDAKTLLKLLAFISAIYLCTAQTGRNLFCEPKL